MDDEQLLYAIKNKMYEVRDLVHQIEDSELKVYYLILALGGLQQIEKHLASWEIQEITEAN